MNKPAINLRTLQITVHKYEFCRSQNELALIELSQNISESQATPICMPSEDLSLDSVLYASGSGVDREFVQFWQIF